MDVADVLSMLVLGREARKVRDDGPLEVVFGSQGKVNEAVEWVSLRSGAAVDLRLSSLPRRVCEFLDLPEGSVGVLSRLESVDAVAAEVDRLLDSRFGLKVDVDQPRTVTLAKLVQLLNASPSQAQFLKFTLESGPLLVTLG